MSTGMQELPRPRRRFDTTATIGAAIIVGRILFAAGVGYVAALLLVAFTPIGGFGFFLIGPFAAGMTELMTRERGR